MRLAQVIDIGLAAMALDTVVAVIAPSATSGRNLLGTPVPDRNGATSRNFRSGYSRTHGAKANYGYVCHVSLQMLKMLVISNATKSLIQITGRNAHQESVIATKRNLQMFFAAYRGTQLDVAKAVSVGPTSQFIRRGIDRLLCPATRCCRFRFRCGMQLTAVLPAAG